MVLIQHLLVIPSLCQEEGVSGSGSVDLKEKHGMRYTHCIGLTVATRRVGVKYAAMNLNNSRIGVERTPSFSNIAHICA